MHSVYERVANLFESAQPTSRRGLLTGGAKVAAGGALGLAFVGAGSRFNAASAQDDATPEAGASADSPFEGPVDVLQYALTLEHLESTFYREGLATFDDQAFIDAGLQTSVREYIVLIGDHEAAHVETLTGVISDLGEEPVTEATYDFGYADLTGFLATAAAVENLGVNAYTGAAQYLIEEDELLTAALTIHGVEARHAAYLNVLTGAVPFPNAVDAPQTPDEVLAIAGPFITGTGADAGSEDDAESDDEADTDDEATPDA